MNLETVIDDDLWASVRTNYESRNFTGAILDAMYVVNNLIRERSGLEEDGVALIGQALGGRSPKLKVNSLQTETERNLQEGVEALMRGMVKAVRNPRSHEKHNDTQQDADAIIHFISYLIGLLKQAKAPFSKTEFLSRVFDDSFVVTDRYAQLLCDEVPRRKRLDVAIDIVRGRQGNKCDKASKFFWKLLDALEADERAQVFGMLSDEFKTIKDNSAIISALQLFPIDVLTHIEEVARLRIENKIIESFKAGMWDASKHHTTSWGALGTYAARRAHLFNLKAEFIEALYAKLSCLDRDEHTYVFEYAWHSIPSVLDPMPASFLRLFQQKLKAGNSQFMRYLKELSDGFDPPRWTESLKDELANFKSTDPVDSFYDDVVPF